MMSSTSSSFSPLPPRPIAIITGGTRGIGKGIATVLASEGYDLVLTYNSNEECATNFAKTLLKEHDDINVKCVGGDITLVDTRDEIFSTLDKMCSSSSSNSNTHQGRRLAALVHNAGQYVGITADNCAKLDAPTKSLAFGDGSLLDKDGRANLDTMDYYHKMYGEAFIDLCERTLVRMGSRDDDNGGGAGGGGTIIGISSPGVCAHYYNADWSYSMPGSGKSLMEYSMRIYAERVASRGINVNCIVPGVTKTDAWTRLSQKRGLGDDPTEMMKAVIERGMPMKKVVDPIDIGNLVKFLCTDSGKYMTGQVIPFDGGRHLR
ncbi:hypothetical protein ACHAWC_007815 [Mediolabrus comicus]